MALIKCKECGKEVSNKAKTCPNCGADVPKGLSPIHVLGIVFAGAIVGLFLIADKPSKPSAYQAPSVATAVSSPRSSSELVATDLKSGTGDFGVRTVQGKVLNTTGKKLTYVQVEINLFDAKDVQVGSTLANVNNLEPGVTWSFEAPIIESRAKTFKIGGITSY